MIDLDLGALQYLIAYFIACCICPLLLYLIRFTCSFACREAFGGDLREMGLHKSIYNGSIFFRYTVDGWFKDYLLLIYFFNMSF